MVEKKSSENHLNYMTDDDIEKMLDKAEAARKRFEAFDKAVNQQETLLYCRGWKVNQVHQLINNIQSRYESLRALPLALGRAHDMHVDGMDIDEIIRRFEPDNKPQVKSDDERLTEYYDQQEHNRRYDD